MTNFALRFPDINYRFPMIYVGGTNGVPYLFGEDHEKTEIHLNGFFISQFLITQTFWEYIMENNPSLFTEANKPVEKVSYNTITEENGFLDKMNEQKELLESLNFSSGFRLLTETEWEYAARGGTYWKDGFRFSGSNDMNEVGWYELNSGTYSDPAIVSKLRNHEKGTKTYEVGLKAPNQLGIYDMCGNVWEWCEDYYQRDTSKIPKDGSPCLIESESRVLRGGCHHNGAIHCTVSKRYEIGPEFADECIGFRIAISA
jgi:sulfatase modifying factor 1